LIETIVRPRSRAPKVVSIRGWLCRILPGLGDRSFNPRC
jgi:hypothetical protein